jgi:hypothetical protein
LRQLLIYPEILATFEKRIFAKEEFWEMVRVDREMERERKRGL